MLATEWLRGQRGEAGYAVPVSRPFLVVLAVVAAMVLVGCGSSKTGTTAQSPTAQALSYFPSDSPLLLTFATDPKSSGIKQFETLKARFPEGALLQTALYARLGQLGINYNTQIKPLFGNPIVFGALSTHLSGARPPYLFVWAAKSQRALNAVIKKLGAGLQSAGSHDGAKLYQAGGETVAVDGPIVFLAQSADEIDGALDLHKQGRGITAAQYAQLHAGIPSGGLMQAFGSLTGVLSTPKAALARRIPWIAAIKSYSASIDAGAGGLTIRYHVDTTGRQVSSSQLPIAAGPQAPSLAGTLPIQTGLRGLSQSLRFTEAAFRAAAPGQYSTFTRRVSKLKQRTGFDLNTFIGLLTGDLNVVSDTHTTIARVGVGNPSAVARMLAAVVRAPGLTFKPGTKVSPLGRGLYEVQEKTTELTLGVVGDQLLLGKATPAQIRAFAAAPSAPVAGTSGAMTFKIALLDLLHLTLKRTPSTAARQFLNLLGDVTGSATATPGGLSGIVTLALR
jgi:hypothetical protein